MTDNLTPEAVPAPAVPGAGARRRRPSWRFACTASVLFGLAAALLVGVYGMHLRAEQTQSTQQVTATVLSKPQQAGHTRDWFALATVHTGNGSPYQTRVLVPAHALPAQQVRTWVTTTGLPAEHPITVGAVVLLAAVAFGSVAVYTGYGLIRRDDEPYRLPRRRRRTDDSVLLSIPRPAGPPVEETA